MVAIVVACVAAAPARAATIHGRVFDDANGDGVAQPGEHGIAHAVVAFGTTGFVETNDAGEYDLEVYDATSGIAWVRVPEGFLPGPVWAEWHGHGAVDLGVRKLAVPPVQPLRFVASSDAHLGLPGAHAIDLATAILAATALDPAPAFFTVLGDVTQGGRDSEIDQVDAALAELAVPWVPVPGNHDWYDGGVVWAARVGPDNYSFDLAGVHFVVWNMALDEFQILRFLRDDLERVTTPVIAFSHAPPSAGVIAALARLHVRAVLTGHAHSNRVVHHAGVTEFNTEPLLMGGLDFTPAGYRVLTLDHGVLTSAHHVTVDHPVLSVISPRCVAASHGDLIVAAELDAGAPLITARVDGGSPIVLRWIGGWDWRGELPVLAPGAHAITVDAVTPTGLRATTTATLDACTLPPAPAMGTAWDQLGGNPAHTGATAVALSTSLAPRWVTPVGGHLLSASPAIANGLVYVTVTDLGDGDTGGVIALDLATGAIRWRTPTAIQVRGGVAVLGDSVVVPQIDGVVLGLDAATGAERWRHVLAEGTAPEAAATFASVAAEGTDAMIGHQRAFAVLDAADGHARWHTNPVPEGQNSQSLAAVAIGDGVVLGTFNRLFGGVQAWDRATGAPLWQLDSDDTVAINATPVIGDHTVFIVDAADQVTALDVATGTVRWRAPLDPTGFEWGNATIATPAYAQGVLIVPTLYRDVVALDARTGAELWRHEALPSPLRATHYRGPREAGYEASPVIAGDTVWIADTSGELAALDLHTGAPQFRAAIGAPVLSGLATTGEWLVVASFDGTVHGFGPGPAAPAVRVAAPTGCATSSPDLFGLLLVAGFVWRTRRR